MPLKLINKLFQLEFNAPTKLCPTPTYKALGIINRFTKKSSPLTPHHKRMDPAGTDTIQFDFPPLFRRYASGRVVRLMGVATVPASLDPATAVASKDVTIDPATGLSARLHLPNSDGKEKLPVLVYFHGGGFCVESAFSPTYHRFLNSLAAKARLLVVSVDYRLAPEHLLPAAYDDSWTALKWVFSPAADPWLAEHGDLNRVFLAGDSAGANIAHQMAMRAADEGEVKKMEGMALIHPFFWGTEPIGSETRDENMRGLIEKLWRVVNEAGVEVDDPRFNVTAEGAPSLAGLGCGRVMVAVAEKDALAERGRAYCERLKGSGWNGEVELEETAGMNHVFHLQQPECDEAVGFMEKLAAFFKVLPVKIA